MKKIKIICISVVLIILVFGVNYVKGASYSFNVTAVSEAKKGDTVSISIVGTGLVGRVNVTATNATLSADRVWVENNTQTVTAKITGFPVKITATPDNLTDKEYNIVKVNGKTITINEKKEVVDDDNKNTSNSDTDKNNNNSTNNNNNNSQKLPASNKPNTNKEKVKNVVEVKGEEEATPQFGMNSLILNAIKENGEKQEITYSPTFNIDTYEYSCDVDSDIKDIEVLTDAGEYNEYVKVEKPDSLSFGENVIKITMNKDDLSLTYTIKVNKAQEVDETSTTVENQNMGESKSETILSFTVLQFIGIILSICLLEGVLLKMPWKKLFRKTGKDIDEE